MGNTVNKNRIEKYSCICICDVLELVVLNHLKVAPSQKVQCMWSRMLLSAIAIYTRVSYDMIRKRVLQ